MDTSERLTAESVEVDCHDSALSDKLSSSARYGYERRNRFVSVTNEWTRLMAVARTAISARAMFLEMLVVDTEQIAVLEICVWRSGTNEESACRSGRHVPSVWPAVAAVRFRVDPPHFGTIEAITTNKVPRGRRALQNTIVCAFVFEYTRLRCFLVAPL